VTCVVESGSKIYHALIKPGGIIILILDKSAMDDGVMYRRPPKCCDPEVPCP
jgi:hypothetical protein